MTEQDKVTLLSQYVNDGVRPISQTDDNQTRMYIEANKVIKELFEKHDRQTFIKEVDKQIQHYKQVDSDRGKAKQEAFEDVSKEYHKLF